MEQDHLQNPRGHGGGAEGLRGPRLLGTPGPAPPTAAAAFPESGGTHGLRVLPEVFLLGCGGSPLPPWGWDLGGGRPLRDRGDGEGEEKQQRRRAPPAPLAPQLRSQVTTSSSSGQKSAAPSTHRLGARARQTGSPLRPPGAPTLVTHHLQALSAEAAWVSTLRWAPPSAATASRCRTAEVRPLSPLGVGPKGGRRRQDRMRERESNRGQGPDSSWWELSGCRLEAPRGAHIPRAAPAFPTHPGADTAPPAAGEPSTSALQPQPGAARQLPAWLHPLLRFLTMQQQGGTRAGPNAPAKRGLGSRGSERSAATPAPHLCLSCGETSVQRHLVR